MTTPVPIALPDAAGALGFEDHVAAHFQDAGFFLHKRVREGLVEHSEDLLELDAVALTPEGEALLIEAKSGKWGIGGGFKILGQMKYLDIDTGVLVSCHADTIERSALLHTKLSPHGLRALSLPVLT